MELDAFRSRLGDGQGRIRPREVTLDAGQFAFVLGEDEPGRFFALTLGDRAEVAQPVDVTDVDLIRAALWLRVPASLQSNLAWEASIVVGTRKAARAIGYPGRTRRITDLAADVSKLAGILTVGVRLELVEA